MEDMNIDRDYRLGIRYNVGGNNNNENIAFAVDYGVTNSISRET